MLLGFSLIEILLGFFLFLLGFTTLFGLFVGTGLPFVAKARDQAIAVSLGERFLNIAKAELLLAPEPPVGETDLTPELASSETLRRSLESTGTMRSVEVRRVISRCLPSTRLFRATVTVRWSDQPGPGKGRMDAVSLSTMVCIPEAR